MLRAGVQTGAGSAETVLLRAVRNDPSASVREHAVFALGSWAALAPLNAFPIGTPEYPDRSATLIVETKRLENDGARLSGPGIRESASLSLPEGEAFVQNNALFPLGLDFYFTCGERVAALPRSTRIAGTSGAAVAQKGSA